MNKQRSINHINWRYYCAYYYHTHQIWVHDCGAFASDEAEDLQQCGSLAGVIKHLTLLKIANQSLTSDERNTGTMEISHSITPTSPSATSHSTSTRTLRKRY